MGIVLASALCSLSEAAVLSLPMTRARILFEQRRKHSKDLLYLKENIALTISTIVILNNVINIVGSIFVGHRIAERLGNEWLGLISAVLTFILIIVSEIIPKTLGERYKVSLSLILARPLRFVIWFFRPFVALLIMITHLFGKKQQLPKVTEEEIRIMLQLGRAEGTVEMDEEVLCNRVFKLNDVQAAQIMKPVDQIFALPADKMLGELKETIMNSRFSRIAVYDKDPLDIVGVVEHRILLREMARDHYHVRVRDFMTAPIFVNSLIKADALLEKFQATHQHFFIVQDSHGKDVGSITMEDVLEELFGEIYDEKDAVRPKSDEKDLNPGINPKSKEP